MPQPLRWSLGIAFLFELAYFVVIPLVALHLTAMGAQPGEIGLWMSLSAAIPALLVLYLGRMADRLGLRRAFVAGSAILAVGAVGLAAARAPWVASLALGLLYLGDAAVVIANQMFIGALGTPQQRVHHFGWMGAAMNVGAMVGPVLGGALAEWRGPQASFYLVAGLALAVVPVLRRAPGAGAAMPGPGLRQVAAAAESGSGVWRQGWGLLALHGVQYAVLATVLTVVANGARNSYYPLFLADAGFSPTLIGVLFSTYSFAGVVLRLATGWLTDRVGSHRVMLAAVAMNIAALVLVPFTQSFAVLAVLAASLGAAHAAVNPVASALLVGSVSAHQRGLVLALRMAVMRAAGVMVPVVLAQVAAGSGPGATLVAAAGMVALIALPLAWLHRTTKQPS